MTVFLDYSKPIVQWYDRVYDWQEIISEAAVGRFLPGSPLTFADIVKDAIEDGTDRDELYSLAVAEHCTQPATDSAMGKLWGVFPNHLFDGRKIARQRDRAFPFFAE